MPTCQHRTGSVAAWECKEIKGIHNGVKSKAEIHVRVTTGKKEMRFL